MLITSKPLIFLDIETNGSYGDTGMIIEIGAVKVENAKEVDYFDTLIDPGDRIPLFIERLTGIKNEDLEAAPTFRQIADKLSSFLEGGLLIAHNSGFDYGFLRNEYSRIDEQFNVPCICSAKLSRAFYPEHKKHNLDSIIERMSLKVENRHRGLDDAMVIWKFYQQCLRDFELETINGAILKQLRNHPNFKLK